MRAMSVPEKNSAGGFDFHIAVRSDDSRAACHAKFLPDKNVPGRIERQRTECGFAERHIPVHPVFSISMHVAACQIRRTQPAHGSCGGFVFVCR